MTTPTDKWCTKCNTKKSSMDDFHKDASTKDGRTRRCKACTKANRKYAYKYKPPSEANRKRCRDWYAKNAEIAKERSRRWSAAHPEAVKERNKKWREANPLRQRELHPQRTYGITVADYNVMLEAQGGVCAICGVDKPGGRSGWFHVDHDHDTGVVRGLLCHWCNVAIGCALDNPEVLRKAADYLELERAA